MKKILFDLQQNPKKKLEYNPEFIEQKMKTKKICYQIKSIGHSLNEKDRTKKKYAKIIQKLHQLQKHRDNKSIFTKNMYSILPILIKNIVLFSFHNFVIVSKELSQLQ